MNRIKKRCKRCGKATTNPKGYCDDCQSHFESQKAQADINRPNATERGYDSRWRAFSKQYLEKHPVCVMCGAKATVTDHRLPIQIMKEVYGENIWDENFYQSLCISCNTRKGMTYDKQMIKNWAILKQTIPPSA